MTADSPHGLFPPGLDVFLAFRPAELVRCADYLPHWGAAILALTRTGQRKLFVAAAEPEDQLPAGVDVERFGWGRLDCADPWGDLLNLVATYCRQTIGPQVSVGWFDDHPMDTPGTSPAETPPLTASVLAPLRKQAGFTFQDPTQMKAPLFQIKTSAAIHGLRLANQVAGLSLEAFARALIPGNREGDLAAEVEAAAQKAMGRVPGVRYARAWALVQSGLETIHAGRFNRTTGRQLEAGDMVQLELSTCVNGYWSDLTRSHTVGTPSARQAEVYRAVLQAQAAAIAELRPGAKGAELDARAREVLSQAGLADYFPHALGHHVGYRYHDPGAPLAPGSDLVLEPGMVITVEPGVYSTSLGFGCRVEDNLLVTATGSELLSPFSRTLQPCSSLPEALPCH